MIKFVVVRTLVGAGILLTIAGVIKGWIYLSDTYPEIIRGFGYVLAWITLILVVLFLSFHVGWLVLGGWPQNKDK